MKAVPDPSEIREPLPGWLVLCSVGGLVATEATFLDFGRIVFAAEGASAHTMWLALGVGTWVALGVMLELQSRSNTGDPRYVALVQRARLHAFVGGLVAGGAGFAQGGWGWGIAGLGFGIAFGVVSSGPPSGPLDLLGRGRLALLGSCFATAAVLQLGRLTAAGQGLHRLVTVADWTAGIGAMVGLVATGLACGIGAKLVLDATRPVANRPDRTGAVRVIGAVVAASSAASYLAGKLFGAPAEFAGSGLALGGTMLGWALLARVGPLDEG